MVRSFFFAFLFVYLCQSHLCARVNALQRPYNLLVILSDEEGTTPFGWEKIIEPWAQQNLPARSMLQERGVVFKRHYVGSTACVPSRGVFYTGQYSGVTGLTQTNGFGKPWDDPGMTWLHENEVPTIGNWLLAAGFMKENVAYFGKFHLADVDLRDDFGNLKQTLSLKNQPNQENINLYREKNLLKAFGFSNGWVGPEPHGAALENSGEYRDPIYVEEIKAFLRVQADLRAKGNNEPFAAFVNLVNPHDIVLAWALKLAGKLNVDPNAPIPPVCEETDYLDLSKEPSVVPEYKKTYNKMYCWDWVMKRLYDGKENIDKLRQFYYTLIKKSDESLVLIFDILKELNLDSETVVIFSSDHGDYRARRKGQQQKWHGLHKEVSEVPLIIAGPGIAPNTITQFTSHVDMVPTILGILDIDEESVRQKLEQKFAKVPPLPGRDLSPLIFQEKEEDFTREIYLDTKDEISKGKNNYAATWYNTLPSWLLPFIPFGTFEPIKGSRYVESIRLYDELFLEKPNEWSFMRYWDPDEKEPDEYRLYRLNGDGYEVRDLSRQNVGRVERYKQKLEQWRSYYHER